MHSNETAVEKRHYILEMVKALIMSLIITLLLVLIAAL